jgi:hypothetical protein
MRWLWRTVWNGDAPLVGSQVLQARVQKPRLLEVSLGREAIARWRTGAGLAATLMLSDVNAPSAKSFGATAAQFTKTPVSMRARHAELKVRRRSAEPGSTEMPPRASWANKTTTIGSPEMDKVAGIRPLFGSIVPLTPEHIIESDELLGSAHDVSFDGSANKALAQGEAISAPQGRADDFAWPRPDFGSARADPELAETEPPRISTVAEKGVPSKNDGRAKGTAAVAILRTLKLWVGQVADLASR